jgi:hypothetical protein
MMTVMCLPGGGGGLRGIFFLEDGGGVPGFGGVVLFDLIGLLSGFINSRFSSLSAYI